MSIGVVTVAVGDRFRAFLPEWAAAVAALQRAPEKITLITDDCGCDNVIQTTEILTDRLTVMETHTPWVNHPQILANEAIEQTHTDWICKLDADDLIYPHAFNRLNTWPTDICMFGINVGDQHNLIPSPVTARQILTAPHNLLFAGSPFRRSVWEKTPGFQDIVYDDWMFWRACARTGATFHPTGTVDYYYRLHDNNSSRNVDHAALVKQVLDGEIG